MVVGRPNQYPNLDRLGHTRPPIPLLWSNSTNFRKRPEAGRFRKFVKFDQSKGLGGRVWPRRSRFGYWFGRPRRRGGEIDDNGV